MAAESYEGNLLPFRVERAERDIEKLDEEKADSSEVAVLAKAVESLTGQVQSLQKVIVGAAISIMIASVIFALTVGQGALHP